MITGSVKSQVDTIWNTFWPGGVSNPITVIEQFTYLLFMRQLDDRQRTAEKAANLLGGEPDPSQMFYDAEHRHLRFSEWGCPQIVDT
ncbi:type I restriction-modification system subunit M N-terminal domain-containing protein [Corynebacterium striatum]